ncbi:sulfotransferase [Alphaproteobacteria bacterium]|nr:sulfotransferase [Alphaproteobacteria bacterium]
MEKTFFVCIGAQKAGTTWLNHYLSKHPEAFIGPVKEINYFSDLQKLPIAIEGLQKQQQELELIAPEIRTAVENRILASIKFRLGVLQEEGAYEQFFTDNVKQAKVFGEVSPAYAALGRSGFRKIIDIYPQAKFIFTLRNPADRFWSQLNFRNRRVESNAPFGDPHINKAMKLPVFRNHCEYLETLNALDQLVPAENVHVMFFENLFGANSQSCIRQLTAFLDIEYQPGNTDRFQNAGKGEQLSEERRARFVKEFAYIYEGIFSRMNGQVPENWREDMQKYLGLN